VGKPIVLFRVDYGFDPERGYGASIIDAQSNKVKGVRANSIRQLSRLVSQAICDAENDRRRFPLEMEKSEPPQIITPNGF
jgi:hypothetical protein